MELERLINDDDAVSPVIGVILMVAITVILAAVIATFVLGLGEQISDTGPTADFDFDYDGEDQLTVTHTNGNVIDAGELYLRSSDGDDPSDSWSVISEDEVNYDDDSEISAGSSVTADEVDADDTVRVVWEPSEGGQSSTLERWDGPEA